MHWQQAGLLEMLVLFKTCLSCALNKGCINTIFIQSSLLVLRYSRYSEECLRILQKSQCGPMISRFSSFEINPFIMFLALCNKGI